MTKKGNIITILILGAIIALIIVSGFIGKIKDNPEGTRGNTPGNLLNYGTFMEEDGKVYFHNYSANGALCSMNSDESDVRLIVNCNAAFINSAGDYLYYYQISHNDEGDLAFLSRNLGVYRSTKDGEKTVCMLKKPVIMVNLIDNFVYYCFQNNETGALGISRKTIQNKKPETLTDITIIPYLYHYGSFFYAGQDGDHDFHAYNVETGTDTTVFEGDIWNPIIDESHNMLYYMKVSDNYKLYRRPLNGGLDTEERVTAERVDCYNIAPDAGYIYYQKNSRSDPAIMRTGLDGSDPEIILPGNYTEINVTSRYVYFRAFDDNTCYHQSVDGPVAPEVFLPGVQ